jgi:hypothetical protein
MDFGALGVLFSALVLAAVVLSRVSSLKPTSPRWRWTYLLTLGGIAILGGVILLTPERYRSIHGFLLSAPWVLLGLCRAPEIWRGGDRPVQVLTLTALLGLGAYAVAMLVFRGGSPHGGLEWGARFALTLYPLLAIMTMWPLAPGQRHVSAYAIWTVFLCLSIGLQLRGLRTIRADKVLAATWNQEIASLPEDMIVSDVWWLPLNNTPVYYEKPVFAVGSVAQFDRWVDDLLTANVDTFCLVTFNDALVYKVLSQSHALLRPVRWISISNLKFIAVQVQPASGRP